MTGSASARGRANRERIAGIIRREERRAQVQAQRPQPRSPLSGIVPQSAASRMIDGVAPTFANLDRLPADAFPTQAQGRDLEIENVRQAASAQEGRDYSPLSDEWGPIAPLSAMAGDLSQAAMLARRGGGIGNEREGRWDRGTRQAGEDILAEGHGGQLMDFFANLPNGMEAAEEARLASGEPRIPGMQARIVDTVGDFWTGMSMGAREPRMRGAAEDAERDYRAREWEIANARGTEAFNRGDFQASGEADLEANLAAREGSLATERGDEAAGADFWNNAPYAIDAVPGIGAVDILRDVGRFAGRQTLNSLGREVPEAFARPQALGEIQRLGEGTLTSEGRGFRNEVAAAGAFGAGTASLADRALSDEGIDGQTFDAVAAPVIGTAMGVAGARYLPRASEFLGNFADTALTGVDDVLRARPVPEGAPYNFPDAPRAPDVIEPEATLVQSETRRINLPQPFVGAADVTVNPSREAIEAILARQGDMPSVKWGVDENGDLLVWDGQATSHGMVSGQPGREGGGFRVHGEIEDPLEIDAALSTAQRNRSGPTRYSADDVAAELGIDPITAQRMLDRDGRLGWPAYGERPQAGDPLAGVASTASDAGQSATLPDWLVRNPSDDDLARLAELGDEMKYVMDTDGNVYAFSAADGHHNQAMRALRDKGVKVRSLGPGAEVTDPDAAGFIWPENGGFVHENSEMIETGPFSAFQQRMRPSERQTVPVGGALDTRRPGSTAPDSTGPIDWDDPRPPRLDADRTWQNNLAGIDPDGPITRGLAVGIPTTAAAAALWPQNAEAGGEGEAGGDDPLYPWLGAGLSAATIAALLKNKGRGLADEFGGSVGMSGGRPPRAPRIGGGSASADDIGHQSAPPLFAQPAQERWLGYNLDPDEVLEQALEEYRIARDPHSAGYILPDGRMLDFSEIGGDGARTLDHRDVAGLPALEGINASTSQTPSSDSMIAFMNATDAVRYDASSGLFETQWMPTRRQIEIAVRQARESQMPLTLEASSVNGNHIDMAHIDRPNVEKVEQWFREVFRENPPPAAPKQEYSWPYRSGNVRRGDANSVGSNGGRAPRTRTSGALDGVEALPDGGPVQAGRLPRTVIDATPDYNPNNIAPAQVIRNPSEADLARLTRRPREADPAHGQNHYNTLRWIRDRDGNVYVGNSFNFTHEDLVQGARRLEANIGETVSGANGTISRKGDSFVTYGVTTDGAPLSRDWLAGHGVPETTRLNDLTNELIDRGLYMHNGDRAATAAWVRQTVGSTEHGQEAVRRLLSPEADITRAQPNASALDGVEEVSAPPASPLTGGDEAARVSQDPVSSINDVGAQSANAARTEADLAAPWPTNPEQRAARLEEAIGQARGSHPWINSDSRATIVAMLSARDETGRFIFNANDVAVALDKTGSGANSVAVLLGRARAAGVPIPARPMGHGGATRLAGGDRLNRAVEILESAVNAGEPMTWATLDARMGIGENSSRAWIATALKNPRVPDKLKDRIRAAIEANPRTLGSRRGRNKTGAAVALTGIGLGTLALSGEEAGAEERGEGNYLDALDQYGEENDYFGPGWRVVPTRGREPSVLGMVPVAVGSEEDGNEDYTILRDNVSGRVFLARVARDTGGDFSSGMSINVLNEMEPTGISRSDFDPNAQLESRRGDPSPERPIRLGLSTVAGIVAGSRVRHPMGGPAVAGLTAGALDMGFGGDAEEASVSATMSALSRGAGQRILDDISIENIARSRPFRAQRDAFALTLSDEAPPLRAINPQAGVEMGSGGLELQVPRAEMAEQGFARNLSAEPSPRERFLNAEPREQIAEMQSANRRLDSVNDNLARWENQRAADGPPVEPDPERAVWFDQYSGEGVFGAAPSSPIEGVTLEGLPPMNRRTRGEHTPQNIQRRAGTRAAGETLDGFIAAARRQGVDIRPDGKTVAARARAVSDALRANPSLEQLRRDWGLAVPLAVGVGAAASQVKDDPLIAWN